MMEAEARAAAEAKEMAADSCSAPHGHTSSSAIPAIFALTAAAQVGFKVII